MKINVTAASFCIVLAQVLQSAPAHAQLSDIFSSITKMGGLKTNALRVLTRQISLAEEVNTQANMALTAGSLAARAQLETTSALLNILQEFGPYAGQGPQSCMSVNSGEDITVAAERANQSADIFLGFNADGSGNFPAPEYESRRAANHLKKYCSAQEHNLGLCTSMFDGLAKFGSDYTKFARTDQLTAKQADAGHDFIAAIAPPALIKQPSSGCNEACQIQQYQARSMSAFASMGVLPIATQLANRTGTKTYLKEK